MAKKTAPKASARSAAVSAEAPAPATNVAAFPGGLNIPALQRIVAATQVPPFYTHCAEFDVMPLERLALVEVNRALVDAANCPAVRSLPAASEYLANIGALDPMTAASPAPAPAPSPAPGTATFPAAVQAAPSAAPVFEIDDDVPMPTARRGRASSPRQSIYPFDSLEVGKSFHIPPTAEKKDPAKEYASMVSSTNARYAVKTGAQAQATRKVAVLDAAGNVMIDPTTGKKVTREETYMRDVTVPGKVFKIFRVDASDKRGPGARVYRIQ